MEPYVFTDGAGDKLVISESDDDRPGALIDTNRTGASPAIVVEPHELAEVVAAMYEAAGQPVPVLPVIRDQAEVTRLTRELGAALSRADRSAAGGMPMRVLEEMARDLLDHGVRLPEATP